MGVGIACADSKIPIAGRHRHHLRVILASGVICIGLLGYPADAEAALHLIRTARAVTMEDANILTDGVSANMYVYPRPSNLDNDKVCSIYAVLYSGDFLESGYFWSSDPTYPTSSPMCFNHRRKDGVHYESEWWGGFTPGHYIPWRIQKRSNTTTWDVVVNGSTRGTWFSTGYGSTLAALGGERYSYSYHNLGSWQHLKYRKWKTTTWYYWPNAEYERYPEPPNGGNPARDPNYLFNANQFFGSTHWLKLSYLGG